MGKANKLTQLQVSRLKEPGLYGDGAGLWLKVTDSGTRSWIFRYTFTGRERWTGLGPYPEVTLAEARDLALEYRRQVRTGIDPLQAKQAAKADLAAQQASVVSFDWCAKQYIEAHRAGWSNAKHAEQWTNSIATYASPLIGELPVGAIETAHVMRVLEPIWTTKSETASRLRGRIESILDWSTVRQYRSGENPARWKGHLDTLLPARSKLARVRHHPALPWAEMAAFMVELQQQPGVGALALQFTILTAARSGEVRGMSWDEVDLETGIWTVPATRMKAGREHRVPLNGPAMLIISEMLIARSPGDSVIFPGVKNRQPLSDMTLTAVLRRMNRSDLTVHGFRSTFRDWAAEVTNYPNEMAEMALAHTVGDRVEAAYRRGDMFEKRRQMMMDWAVHCSCRRIAPPETIGSPLI